jgi:hypothetical protein
MTATRDEIERREKCARDAIKRAFGTKEDEFGATLFVSHHLNGIEASYWQKHFGTANREPRRVLDILELRAHWGDEDDDGIDTFDFTLPGRITNYVISVRFGATGQVEKITMES